MDKDQIWEQRTKSSSIIRGAKTAPLIRPPLPCCIDSGCTAPSTAKLGRGRAQPVMGAGRGRRARNQERLESVGGSVLSAGEWATAGSTGQSLGEISADRHSRSPTGPVPCHVVPGLSSSPWLLFHCRSLYKTGFSCSSGSSLLRLESGEGQSAWELKVEFFFHPSP